MPRQRRLRHARRPKRPLLRAGQRSGLHRGANNVGECGTGDLVVTGPTFQQHDISVAKTVRLVGRTDFEFRAEILNAFNHVNFTPVGGIGNAIANSRVTGLTGTNTSLVVQLVARFNW